MGVNGYRGYFARGNRGASIFAFSVSLRLIHTRRARTNGCHNWAFTLSCNACPGRLLAKGAAAALFEVALQFAFQEKLSYTTAIRGLLGSDEEVCGGK